MRLQEEEMFPGAQFCGLGPEEMEYQQSSSGFFADHARLRLDNNPELQHHLKFPDVGFRPC